jgi:ABC-type sugar transport system substrate-binding protein
VIPTLARFAGITINGQEIQTMKNILLFCVCLVVLCSCSKQTAPTHKTIGVSLLTRAHVFYKDLEEGLRTEAAKNGYELVITSGD